MKLNDTFKNKKWTGYTVTACIAVVLFVALSNLGQVFEALGVVYGYIKPVVIGIVIAYIINPLAEFFKRTIFKGIKKEVMAHSLSVALAFILIALLIIIMIILLVPQLGKSISSMIENSDTYVATLTSMFDSIQASAKTYNIDLSGITLFEDDLVGNLVKWVSDNLQNIITTSYSIGTGFFSFIISVILSLYFLLDKKRMVNGVKRLFMAIYTKERYADIAEFWRKCDAILVRYIICDIVDGFVIGIVNGIFMAIMHYPYVALVSVIVGVTNLAPTFGPIIGAVIGAFVLVLVNPIYALVFVIFTVVLQTLDGYIIKPKLFGESLGIPAVLILVAIIVGGNIFGVLGILLAIPFAGIFILIYEDIILPGLSERKERKNDKQ